jgi:hypothetical protein
MEGANEKEHFRCSNVVRGGVFDFRASAGLPNL